MKILYDEMKEKTEMRKSEHYNLKKMDLDYELELPLVPIPLWLFGLIFLYFQIHISYFSDEITMWGTLVIYLNSRVVTGWNTKGNFIFKEEMKRSYGE